MASAGRPRAPAPRRRWRGGAALALAGLLAACQTAPQGAPIQLASEARLMAPEDAFAIPGPGGPAVTAVVQRHYANAIEQRVILAGASQRPGENMLVVQLFGRPISRSADHATLDNALFDMGKIWLEMDERLPGVGMVVSPYFVQNKYGPFGYAMGRYANDLCLYAWQRVGEVSLTLQPGAADAAVGIRLRLCKTGATERQLLDAMYGFTINAYYADGDWNPYGRPGDIAVLGAGQIIYPPDDVLEPVRAPRVAATPAPQPAPPVVTPTPLDPSGPAVPPPPGGGGPSSGGGGGPLPLVPPPP
ncbi:MAG: cellulose biosynthesis protein BcsN [Bauldia sp.]|nr:cellulose biosynthesis protein BcsN [Bauldia sp.]